MINTWLEYLLTARASILLTHTIDAPPGRREPHAIVPTHRLILVTRGSLDYTIEQHPTPTHQNDLRLVPAWTHRAWQADADTGCSLAWVEFILHPTPLQNLPPIHLPHAPTAYQDLHDRTRSLAHTRHSHDALLAEMSLKHLLALLLAHPRQPSITPPAARDATSAASHAVAVLRQHLHHPDALDRMFAAAAVSPAKLRVSFRQTLGTSPAACLHALRMQQARYLLMTTSLSVKQVARKVGYEDPLYFSRRYKQYWRRPPAQDRAPNP